MGNVFDTLQQELEKRAHEAGITPLDLADLPSPMKKVMLLILRENEIAYPDLVAAVAELPEQDRLSKEQLDLSVRVLYRDGWLIRLGLDDVVTYKVNLRRKEGSRLGQGVWGQLGSRINPSQSQ